MEKDKTEININTTINEETKRKGNKERYTIKRSKDTKRKKKKQTEKQIKKERNKK
jgi:hypothetical protein